MAPSLPTGLINSFLWCEAKGYGWHSAPPMQYDGKYFAHYQELDATPMGEALTKARLELVGKYMNPRHVVDIGIGGGRFKTEAGCRGFDVSDEANDWLGVDYIDPYECKSVKAVTCWDSLEHIPEPEKLLARVKTWLFVSMPIYDNLADVLQSKHYKPSEHLHYFTLQGFIAWCAEQGFECVEINHAETELGREGITSFAFKRVSG